MKFVYTAWLMNLALPSDDPECEWPACFIIEGGTETSAKEWGDRLAEKYASANGQRFLRSAAEPVARSTLPGLDTLPVVIEGEEATDHKIGW